jgi:Zn-dependent protease
MFGDLSSGYLIQVATVILIMLLVAFPVHEFSHALAAVQLGDSTPRLLGRLTLDPRAHFDPAGATILAVSMLIGFGIGWAKPTPYNPMNLRGGRWGEAIIAVAGPISNFVLAIAAALPLRYIHGTGMNVPFLEGVLTLFVTINLLLMVFNLIPIPPLDGSKVLYAFLDPRRRSTGRRCCTPSSIREWRGRSGRPWSSTGSSFSSRPCSCRSSAAAR